MLFVRAPRVVRRLRVPLPAVQSELLPKAASDHGQPPLIRTVTRLGRILCSCDWVSPAMTSAPTSHSAPPASSSSQAHFTRTSTSRPRARRGSLVPAQGLPRIESFFHWKLSVGGSTRQPQDQRPYSFRPVAVWCPLPHPFPGASGLCASATAAIIVHVGQPVDTINIQV